MIKRVRTHFTVDLMKSCHHGASDVTDEFLEATRPAAFVVSSGDEEGHVHPRPDILGLLGKKGRGDRPLVLCTELLRSTREKEDPALKKKLRALVVEIDEEGNSQKKKLLEHEHMEIVDELMKRNGGVYGAINLRTDGRRAVVAFRREQSKGVKRWFAYELEKDSQGIFQVQNVGGH